MVVDMWQVAGSLAASAFTIGFVDQVRITYRTRKVAALSFMQWVVFAGASTIFAGYYVHLNQWIMAGISMFGTICCLAMLGMICRYRLSETKKPLRDGG